MSELEDKGPGEEQEEAVTASKSQPVDLNQGGKYILVLTYPLLLRLL